MNPSLQTENESQSPVSNEDSATVEFLQALFRLLDEENIRYCVLHSWESLPCALPSDLDVAIHPQDRARLPIVFRRLQKSGYLLIQCFNYSVNAFYFVFCWFDGLALRSVPLDFIFEHWRSGLCVLSVEDIIAHRERFGGFWIPSPSHQFAYLIAKKIWKGTASPEQVKRLTDLVLALGREKAEVIAGDIFIGNWNRRLVDACLNGSLLRALQDVRDVPWTTAMVRHPLRFVRYACRQVARLVRRWLNPAGLLIAVLGPDGSGKDTVISGMSQEIRRGFRRIRLFHWRPNVLFPRASRPPVTDPHALEPRGRVISSLYLVGFVLDYWVGYVFRIRYSLSRGTLVIFDRYFYDVIVDPKRTRFAGPQWFAILLARLVPRPDLTLVLDANEHVMYARKRELSVNELQRQRQAYQGLDVGSVEKKTIRTDQDVARSVAEAMEAVVKFLHERFERRDEEWLRESAA